MVERDNLLYGKIIISEALSYGMEEMIRWVCLTEVFDSGAILKKVDSKRDKMYNNKKM